MGNKEIINACFYINTLSYSACNVIVAHLVINSPKFSVKAQAFFITFTNYIC